MDTSDRRVAWSACGCTGIQFAQAAGLAGVVANVAPLLRAPRLIRSVKQAGLLLLTYGGENNDPANVRVQRQWGVDTIIAGMRGRGRHPGMPARTIMVCWLTIDRRGV